MSVKEVRGIRKTLRKLHSCVKCSPVKVTWTVKWLNRVCEHEKLQPECRKYCCKHCPESGEEEA